MKTIYYYYPIIILFQRTNRLIVINKFKNDFKIKIVNIFLETNVEVPFIDR